jgi:hypothetical protein
MAIGVNWAEVWAPVWKAVWTQTPPVQVPDVVGQTQADGTNALEADGFVVAVATAYSSVVQAGLIISQDPAAGSTPGTGATVTITVSLGEAPPASETSGGFFFGFDRHLAERRRRKEREEELKREADEIQAELDREIARLLHEQEARDAERADLARIQALADRYAGTKQPVPRKIAASLLKAQEERTRNSLLQLQREMQQMFEEEEAAVIAVLMMDSD